MTDLIKLRNDILREMYAEAEPPLDFDEALANPKDQPDNWCSQHYLSNERQREILDKHLAKHDLSEREINTLTWHCILNLGPMNVPPDDA